MNFSARTTAALMALALTAGLGGCAGGVQPDGQDASPTVSATQTADPTTSEPAPAPEPEVIHLGPNGYGELELGMSKAEALDTGFTVGLEVEAGGTCGGEEDGSLNGVFAGDDDYADGRLFFSANSGKLIAIYAGEGISTPEGITLGSSRDDVLAAYPEWEPIVPDPDFERGYARVPGNPDAHYRILVVDGVVVELSLDSMSQDCYE